jgi:hypothetical protein
MAASLHSNSDNEMELNANPGASIPARSRSTERKRGLSGLSTNGRVTVGKRPESDLSKRNVVVYMGNVHVIVDVVSIQLTRVLCGHNTNSRW